MPMRRSAQRSRHGKIVHPAAMPFVSSHHRCDHSFIDNADQEQLGLYGELAGDVLMRVVPRPREAAFFPQRDDSGLIGTLEGTYLHHGVSALANLNAV